MHLGFKWMPFVRVGMSGAIESYMIRYQIRATGVKVHTYTKGREDKVRLAILALHRRGVTVVVNTVDAYSGVVMETKCFPSTKEN